MDTLSSEIHNDHYNTLLNWIKSPQNSTTPTVAFLYGPPGVGKTTLAHRVVADSGLCPVECNASQFRHKAAMSELIEPLLNSNNVADYFRPEGHRRLGIILDEIDGMSAGDRGGLTELVRILKDYKGPNTIICISNEWQENRYKPLLRLSLCIHIEPPDPTACAAWLHKPLAEIQPLWLRHQGDLRKLQQTDTLTPYNEITHTPTVEELVMRLLTGKLSITPQEHLNLDNNDFNLAGLHLHETLPDWIREHYASDANTNTSFQIYKACLTLISTSDRQDYYTFFHQHWALFPLSFQTKLHAVNHLLFATYKPKKLIPASAKGWKFKYTSALSRQSWLFNQFKYLCEFRDYLQGLDCGAYRDGGLEMALATANQNQNALDTAILSSAPKDRLQRWLTKLVVPECPPCP